MIKALFVDDDTDVLEGLENRLFSIRTQIHGSYVNSASRALELLAQEEFDAVVSDMRMPGMDGAALLMVVKAEYPKLIRVILSGETGPEGFMRALHVAHQVLSKPCDTAQLSRVLEECMSLRKMISSPHVVDCVGRFNTLPSAPQVCMRLDQVMANPKMRISDISAVIEQDPSMTARILQVVNSAYFSTRKPVDTVHDAVRFLGTEMVRSLAMAHELYQSLSKSSSVDMLRQLDRLQHEALVCAQFAKVLTEVPELKPLAFTAGMLRNIGRIAMINAQEQCRCEGEFNQNLVGAYMLSIWGLPFRLIEAVAYADQPSMREQSFPPKNNLSAVLHLAGIFTNRFVAGTGVDTFLDPDKTDADYLRTSGLKADELKQLEQRCRASLSV